MPYNAEKIAIERGSKYSKAILPFLPYVVEDGNLITGQNPFSAKKTATLIVAALEK